MLIGALLAKRPIWPSKRLAIWIVPLGLISITITYGLMFMSPAFTNAGIASILGNTQPLVVVGLATILLNEPISRRKIAALTLGTLGVIAIAAPVLRQENGFRLTGALLALGTSACSGVASVVVKKLRPGNEILAWTAWQLLFGAFILFSVSSAFESKQLLAGTSSFSFF